jgi:hypothetical protein
MNKSILIFSNSTDWSTSYVMDWLMYHYDCSVSRYNEIDIFSREISFSLIQTQNERSSFKSLNFTMDSRPFDSVWLRRPPIYMYNFDKISNKPTKEFAQQELKSFEMFVNSALRNKKNMVVSFCE